MKTPDKVLSTSLDLAFSFVGLSHNNTTSENGIFNSKLKTVKLLKGYFRFRPEACKEGRSETLRPTGARALYELIYPIAPLYEGCPDATGARQALTVQASSNVTNEADDYQIAPNPARDFIKINSPSGITAKLVIVDATGRKVIEKKIKFENNTSIISVDMMAGIYDVVICDEGGRIYSKKILISE